MLPDFAGASGVAFIVAVTPACLLWLWGRTLVQASDDPALPERLAAGQRRNRLTLGGAAAILIWGWPSLLYWTLPVALLARNVASYSLRRTLYAETWSLPVYLFFLARVILSFYGFWILLAFMPTLASAAGAWRWPVVLTVAAILVGWNGSAAELLRFLLRPKPVADAVLRSRFEELVTASGVPAPRFEYIDLRGGAIANAIALPSLRQSSVIVTDTLLKRLDADEIVAICAHEIAHLEYYNHRLMRRISRMNYALIALGAASTLAADPESFVALGWAGILVLTLVLRARYRQRHETESDLRAVALTGDGEALVSGLTKVYTFARIPRRWETRHEHHATHPSLARRIRAIRAATGAAPRSLSAPASFSSTDGRTVVTFGDEQLQFVDGGTATHALNYSRLTELRLDARRSGAIRLVAVERNGRRWETPIAESDVATIQAALDDVDGRLSDPTALPSLWPRSARVVVTFAALIAVAGGQFAMIVVAVLAWIQPATPLLLASGIAAMMTALLAGREPAFGGTTSVVGLALVLASFGVTLLSMARSTRGDGLPARVRPLVGLLAGCAICAFAAIVVRAPNLVHFHQAARSTPAAAVLMTALAGALASWQGRAARAGAAAAALTGVTAAAAGSIGFLDRFAGDPLLVHAPVLAMRAVPGQPIKTFEVPYDIAEMNVSADGRFVAIMQESESDREDAPSTFHVGAPGGTLTTIRADELLFVDDDQILLLDSRDEGTRLRQLRLGSTVDVVWQQDIPEFAATILTFNPATRRWQALGWTRNRQLTRAGGELGAGTIDTMRWPGGSSRRGWVSALAASGTEALVIETAYDRTWFSTRFVSSMSGSQAMQTTFWRLNTSERRQTATSRLRPECFEGALNDERVVCSVYDGERTRFVAIDAMSDGIEPVGVLRGRFVSYRHAANGWLSGWLDSTAVALHLSTRHGIHVERRGSGWISEVAANDGVAVTVSPGESTSTVRMYELPR